MRSTNEKETASVVGAPLEALIGAKSLAIVQAVRDRLGDVYAEDMSGSIIGGSRVVGTCWSFSMDWETGWTHSIMHSCRVSVYLNTWRRLTSVRVGESVAVRVPYDADAIAEVILRVRNGEAPDAVLASIRDRREAAARGAV